MMNQFTLKAALYMLAAFALVACQRQKETQTTTSKVMADLHSYAKPDQIAVKHMHLDLDVSFETKTIAGTVTLDLLHNDKTADTLWLDTKALVVESVLADGKPTEWKQGQLVEHMGQSLAVVVTPATQKVAVKYKTTAASEALQWLEPNQTTGKKQPFLFTQGEAILTRSWVPCQDSPGVRITWSADVTVPAHLMAVMSAHGNPTTRNADGRYKFDMDLPVAPYLIALAAGDLAFKTYDDVTGVYAEPAVLEASHQEFVQMRDMVNAASNLYGPYIWGRYDLLVLPASFPFGGMENPCLTFATPTILAGDKSLVSLVAHELAHSWSGNTVTNATWNDFWLNEGFTVYFERRIMEAIEGPAYADMLAVLGYQDLVETVNELGPTSPDTRLKLDLTGRNPDDGMTDIAYEKGYFLLRYLEQKVGRTKWDAFLKGYFDHFKLKSIVTEDFLARLDDELLKPNGLKLDELAVKSWIYEPGLPQALVVPKAARFDAVDAYIQQHKPASGWDVKPTTNWSTHEWLRFLRAQPDTCGLKALQQLDKSFAFSKSHNAEIQAVWYRLAALNGYEPAKPAMTSFLIHTGRRKFLTPTYKAIIAGPWGMDYAKSVYAQARPNYHFVATNTLDALIK